MSCFSVGNFVEQLIDKEPSKAIPLFWRAINTGDRVDSALKDMAVVMKQLDRSDEAIEAITSFRHLCSYDAQESLDNILIEMYKVIQRFGPFFIVPGIELGLGLFLNFDFLVWV